MQDLSELAITEATVEDLSDVLELYRQPSIDDGHKLPLPEAERIFRRIASYPDYKIYLARYRGIAVGTFALLIMDNLGHLGAPSGVVEDVAVSPQMQKKGIGRAMMQFAREKCRQAGCYKMALSSNIKRESAHLFYESLGFARHGYSFLIETRK
jgi:GNAT superfamily N-acetyltransferase